MLRTKRNRKKKKRRHAHTHTKSARYTSALSPKRKNVTLTKKQTNKRTISAKVAHQLLCSINIPLRHDSHQVSPKSIPGVDLRRLHRSGKACTKLAQHSQDLDAAVANGVVDAGHSKSIQRMRVCASAEQLLDDGGETLDASEVEWGTAVIVAKVDELQTGLGGEGGENGAHGGDVLFDYGGHESEAESGQVMVGGGVGGLKGLHDCAGVEDKVGERGRRQVLFLLILCGLRVLLGVEKHVFAKECVETIGRLSKKSLTR